MDASIIPNTKVLYKSHKQLSAVLCLGKGELYEKIYHIPLFADRPVNDCVVGIL